MILGARNVGRPTVSEVLPVIDELEVAFEGRVCVLDTFEDVEHT